MLLLLDSCHVPIAIPANFAAARATSRVVGGALASNRVAIVRVVFSETAFSIVLASARGDMSQWTLLWTTNPILRIRTAGRRFLTKTTSEPSRQDTTVPPLVRRFKSRRRRSRKLPPLAMSAMQVSAAREVREGVLGRAVDRRYASDP
jgi:hypothetical protein